MSLGRHEGMPAVEYHAETALGSTSIRTIAELSVAHLLAKRETSPAMRLGSINHTAVLEPEKFDDTYLVAPRGPCPKCPSGRKSMVGAVHCHQHGGKQESQEWHDSLPAGTEVIDDDEKTQALELAAGVRVSVERSLYPQLLSGGAREVSYFATAVKDGAGWTITSDKNAEGVPVKARVDIDYPGLCVDLKGVGRVDMLQPRKWSWRIHDMGMHIQAALYADIVEAVTGQRPVWGWLVHQTEAPYATRLFVADEADLDDGRIAVGNALEKWQRYKETGDPWNGWPRDKDVVARPRFLREEEG